MNYEWWTKSYQKVQSLSVRERLLVQVVGLALIYLLIETLLLAPLYERISVQETTLHQTRYVYEISNKMLPDGSIPEQNEEAKLRQEITSLTAELVNQQKDIYFGVKAKDMVLILSTIIGSGQDIDIISVENELAEAVPDASMVYQHPVKIQMTGDFHSMMGYLKTIEQLELPIVFNHLDYEVVTHPKSKMSITLHFLTQDKEFIEF